VFCVSVDIKLLRMPYVMNAEKQTRFVEVVVFNGLYYHLLN